MISYYPVFSRT